MADIGGLDVGDVVRWGDLRGTEALTLAHEEADLVVATIAPPTVEPPAEEEAPAEPVATEAASGDNSEA